MRGASLHCCRLRPNQFEKDQAWLEEDRAQPETGCPTEYVRDVRYPMPELRYRWMSSKLVILKNLLLILFPTCLRVYYITNQAF